MADDDIQYDYSYEGSTESLGPSILYPLIASVFSGFCMLTIAIFLIANRKCCTKKKEDTESTLLKQRLATEQKKMSKYKLQFPTANHPLFSSIMQQEDNDIAQEVKESYKEIGIHIQKPIICCPHNKTSYIYNPQQFNICDDKTQKSVCSNQKAASVADGSLKKDALKLSDKFLRHNFSCNETAKQNDNANNNIISVIHEFEKSNVTSLKKIRHKNFFTNSEIKKTEDIKSLLFTKWIKETGNEEGLESNDVITSYTEHDFSYDDVESVLTSISRMDSNRLQRLKDSKFYKQMLTQIDPIPAHDSDCSDDESIDPVTLDEIMKSKTGTITVNLTHDELMQVIIDSNDKNSNNECKLDMETDKKLDSSSKQTKDSRVNNENTVCEENVNGLSLTDKKKREINRNTNSNTDKNNEFKDCISDIENVKVTNPKLQINNTDIYTRDNGQDRIDNAKVETIENTEGSHTRKHSGSAVIEALEVKNNEEEKNNDKKDLERNVKKSSNEIDKKSESLFRIIKTQRRSVTPRFESSESELNESVQTVSNIVKQTKDVTELNGSSITESVISNTSKRSSKKFDTSANENGKESKNESESESDLSTSATETSIYSRNTSYVSRPNSLDLRRKHTDLYSSQDELVSTRKTSFSKSEIKVLSDSYSATSKTSSITTWQEIYQNKQLNEIIEETNREKQIKTRRHIDKEILHYKVRTKENQNRVGSRTKRKHSTYSKSSNGSSASASESASNASTTSRSSVEIYQKRLNKSKR